MTKKKYGFQREFTERLNGPFPFFVICLYGNSYRHRHELRDALWRVLVEITGDDFCYIFDYYYLLEIRRLIKLGLVPHEALFIEMYIKDSNLLIFCKSCPEALGKVCRVLRKESLDEYQWKLITLVNRYRDIGLEFVKLLAYMDFPCPDPDHPSHDRDTEFLPIKKDNEVKDPVTTQECEELEDCEVQGLSLPLVGSADAIKDSFDYDWEAVEDGLQKLHSYSREEILEMCRSGDPLIGKLRGRVVEMSAHHQDSERRLLAKLEDNLTAHLGDLCASMDAHEGACFLKEVLRNWYRFYPEMLHIQQIFCPVGALFSRSFEFGLELWGTFVVQPGKWIHALVECINRERCGDDVDRDMMREMLCMAGLFTSWHLHFERFFIDSSQTFYRANSQCLKECCSLDEYLKQVEIRLDKELELIGFYLDEYHKQVETQLKIVSVFGEQYFTKQNEWLTLCFNQGLLDDNYEVLARMHGLLYRLPDGSSQMKAMLISHVSDTLKVVIDGSSEPNVAVQHLLLTRQKYDRLINESLDNEKSLENALNSSFRKIVNFNSESAKSLSVYIGCKLREALNVDNKQAIDSDIEKAIKLIEYLDGDTFMWVYWHYFADRLINKASSFSAERHILETLKVHYGSYFTSNLEHMLTEMEMCQYTMEGFKGSLSDHNDCPNLSAMVLGTCYWPMKPLPACNLPPELHRIQERFQSYYLGCHKNRSMLWQTHMGSAHLEATFENGQRHELIVSIPQMCILMLFNSAQSLSYSEIKEATHMGDTDLKHCLESLFSASGIVNLKNDGGGDFCENGIWSINEKFSNKSFKVNLQNLAPKHVSEPERVVESVEEARYYHIDAAIARIMKSRKSLDHSTLVSEVTDALQPLFMTTPSAIKRRIEYLIGDGLLEREHNDFNCYRYV